MRPPFRADHVGSLLRPPYVKTDRERAIREIVAKQEALGLEAVTDGEFSRDWWHLDFLTQLEGVTARQNPGPKFGGTEEQPPIPTVTGKVRYAKPIMIEDFAFLKSATRRTAKFTIPSPSMLHLRAGRAGIAYEDMEEFWADAAQAYRDALAALALAQKPAGMTVAMHTCRGNFKSAWVAEGGYEPVAEAMFSSGVDAFFMEFDTERAGGFEPLRFVPRGKTVVLGLVSSKTPKLESKDELKRRIEQAAKHVPLENLCLSPQCGFSSTHHGNALTPDEQWRKLSLVVEVAREVWRS
jgi:5-methyltetrahydropteroyltriglutamate--homocysteine methyltransferase